jgi:hypothetical protein
MSLIGSVQSATPCNSFPKIFGGYSSSARLYHIDVYNDYLALAGDSGDSTLTGISLFIPLLTLASISTGGKYYWSKALSLNIASSSLHGVKFSTDGTLLIAHSSWS